MLPEACFADSDPFRLCLRDPLVSKVLERRQADMIKVFKHYAQMEMTDKRTTLCFKEFMRLMMDCKVIDEVCTHHALQQIFIKLQDEDDTSKGQTEMLFHEFVDAICAVAAFKNPAPYLPLHLRVQPFWQNWIVPPLKKVLKLTDGALVDRTPDVDAREAAPPSASTLGHSEAEAPGQGSDRKVSVRSGMSALGQDAPVSPSAAARTSFAVERIVGSA